MRHNGEIQHILEEETKWKTKMCKFPKQKGWLKAHRQGIIGGLIGVTMGAIVGVAGYKVYAKKADTKANVEIPAIPEVASDTSTDTSTDNVTL